MSDWLWLTVGTVGNRDEQADRLGVLAEDFSAAVSQDADWTSWWRASGLGELVLSVVFLSAQDRLEHGASRYDSVLAGRRSCEAHAWVPTDPFETTPRPQWGDVMDRELLAVLRSVASRLELPDPPTVPEHGEGWHVDTRLPATAAPPGPRPAVRRTEEVRPRPLTEELFWAVVGELRQQVDDAALDRLRRRLERLRSGELLGFADQLAEKLHALDTPAHFRQRVRVAGQPSGAAPVPLSEDVFLYVRCAVVARGRITWLRAVKDPAVMAGTWDLAAEHLLHLPREVYEARTGRLWEHEPVHDVETGSSDAWNGS